MGITEDAAKKLARGGKITANEGLYAIVGAIAQARSGGQLGAAGEKYATQTFEGLQEKFKDFKEQIFGDIVNTSGFSSFKGFFANLNEAMSPDSTTGKHIRATVTTTWDRVMSSVFGPMSGAEGLERIDKIVTRVTEGFEALVAGGRILWNMFEGMTEGVLKGFGIEADKIFGADGSLDPAKIQEIADKAHVLGEKIGIIAAKFEKAADAILGFSDALKNAEGFGEKATGAGAWLLDKVAGPAVMPWAPSAISSAVQLAQGASHVSSQNTAHVQVNLLPGSPADPHAIGQAAAAGTSQALQSFDLAGHAMGAVGH